MTDNDVYSWLTSSTPGQFLVGVAVLIFGSRQILSEKNLSSSLSGLSIPFRWVGRMRDRAAALEADEIEMLKRENARLFAESMRMHRWAVYTSRYIKSLEVWAAAQGIVLPPPRFRHLHEYEDDEEDEDA